VDSLPSPIVGDLTDQACSLTLDEEKPEPLPEIVINKQEFVEDFNRQSAALMASGKSPYSRRYPMSTKRDNQWISNSSSDEELKIKINDNEKSQLHDSGSDFEDGDAPEELDNAHGEWIQFIIYKTSLENSENLVCTKRRLTEILNTINNQIRKHIIV
jgi:hypothetical protein